jgi:hypothetical protein
MQSKTMNDGQSVNDVPTPLATPTAAPNVTSSDDLARLRAILLQDDRSALRELQELIHNRALLSQKVDPIVEQHISFLRQNFPKEYGAVINKMITQKIKDSQTEILDAIYPVLGKMISKYIAFQFQQLKESIDAQMKQLFSTRGLGWYIRVKIMGINPTDALMATLDKPQLEEIFVIERNSGILMGNAALQATVEREAVAGMLTAIKAFVEDAFERSNEDIELLQYGSYRIMLQNFNSYYFALMLHGSVSAIETEKFRAQVLDFVLKNPHLRDVLQNNVTQDELNRQLDEHFIAPQRIGLDKMNIRRE